MRSASDTPPVRGEPLRASPTREARPGPTSGKASEARLPMTRTSAASSTSAPAPIAAPSQHRDGRRRKLCDERRRITEPARRGQPRLADAHSVARVDQQRTRRLRRETLEIGNEARARLAANVGQRPRRQRDDRDRRHQMRARALASQAPDRASSLTSARSASESCQAPVSAALARTCSGVVAPAITLATAGQPASHESASSGSVCPWSLAYSREAVDHVACARR